MLVNATIIKRETANGYFEIHHWIPIGSKLRADLGSIVARTAFAQDRGVYFAVAMIECIDAVGMKASYPVELLDIPAMRN